MKIRPPRRQTRRFQQEPMRGDTTMAEGHRMTAAELVAKVMAGEHGDFVREAVALIAHELMEAEISAEVGAELHEVSPERITHRNGYRPRPWETRVGEIELLIPRKRQGPAYFPSFLEPRRRSEQAIVTVVLEAYVNGVSTRKVDRLVEQLGIAGMTKDRVSALCRARDGLRRPQGALPGRVRRAGARAHGPGDRAPGAHRAQGLSPPGRCRGGPARLLRLPRGALAEVALDESSGARQPRDRPSIRRRRHLPQRRLRDPSRRCAADRAERRVVGLPALRLDREHGPLRRSARRRRPHTQERQKGGGRAQRSLHYEPNRRAGVTPLTTT